MNSNLATILLIAFIFRKSLYIILKLDFPYLYLVYQKALGGTKKGTKPSFKIPVLPDP